MDGGREGCRDQWIEELKKPPAKYVFLKTNPNELLSINSSSDDKNGVNKYQQCVPRRSHGET